MTILLLAVILSTVTPLISVAQYGGDPRRPLGRALVKRPFWCRCYPIWQDSKAGVVYGIRQNAFGLKLYDYRPWMFGIPLFLRTDLDWRASGNGNTYFDVDFVRDFLSYQPAILSPEIGYKRIVFDKTTLIHQFRSGIGLSFQTIGVMLGYTRQWRRISDASVVSESGIMVKVDKELFQQVEVNASVTYWFDEFQYSLKIKEDLFCSGVIVGIGLERIGNWNEVDFSIMFRYH